MSAHAYCFHWLVALLQKTVMPSSTGPSLPLLSVALTGSLIGFICCWVILSKAVLGEHDQWGCTGHRASGVLQQAPEWWNSQEGKRRGVCVCVCVTDLGIMQGASEIWDAKVHYLSYSLCEKGHHVTNSGKRGWLTLERSNFCPLGKAGSCETIFIWFPEPGSWNYSCGNFTEIDVHVLIWIRS